MKQEEATVSDRLRRQVVTVAIAAIVIAILVHEFVGFTYVQPGYVGIKVKLYGTERGVQDLPIVTGRVWYNPWTERIYDFPTFLQYKVWTASSNEGSPNDESITFVTKDRIQANVDVSVAYQFMPQQGAGTVHQVPLGPRCDRRHLHPLARARRLCAHGLGAQRDGRAGCGRLDAWTPTSRPRSTGKWRNWASPSTMSR